MKSLEWSQHFPTIILWIFFRCSRAANSTVLGPIWSNFELIRDVIDVLVTCKNEEDSIKNEGARVFTPLEKGGQCHITKQLMHSFSVNIRICQPSKVMSTSA